MAMVVVPILLGLYLLWTVRTEILPFILGTAIAYVMAPAVTRLARVMPRRETQPYVARGLAIVVLYLAVIGAGAGIGFLVVPNAADEIQTFSDNLPETIDSARERFQDLYDRYVPAEAHDSVNKQLTKAGDSAGDAAGQLVPNAVKIAGNTFAILLGYLTIPVWLFYTLKDHPRGVRSFIGMFPPDWRHDVRNVLGIADAVFKNYIRAVLLQGITIGVMAYIVLALLDVRYPIGLAILAGLTEAIPIIGPIISAVPAILVSLAQDPLKALWVALAFLGIQQFENHVIVPKVQGDFFRLHPGVIIVLLVVAGALGGILFVILAVPAAAFARDLYQYAYLRLGDVPPDPALDRALGVSAAQALRQRLTIEAVVPEATLGNRGFGSDWPEPAG
jgi:predicted PurR-regulated permease PerM